MRNNYNMIKRQLKALQQENTYLKDDNELLQNLNDSSFQQKMEKERENEKLYQLAKLGSSLNIIMTQMLSQCDEDTLVGSAYKSAILQFQRALAEGFGYTRQSNNDNQTDGAWKTSIR